MCRVAYCAGGGRVTLAFRQRRRRDDEKKNSSEAEAPPCRLEALQFDTSERLAKVVALYAPIALRIVQLRDLSRLAPQASCTIVLGDEQWKALWAYIHKQPVYSGLSPPTIRQATLWIGRLGGHLGRKSDGLPGVRTLWAGWRDLALLTDFYQSLEN